MLYHKYFCSLQLTILPNQFGKMSDSFTDQGSNFLTLNGPGLFIPRLHETSADHKFCGSVYLALFLDGPSCKYYSKDRLIRALIIRTLCLIWTISLDTLY